MTSSKLAFIFPGQGSQSVGMGKEFFDSWAFARRCFEMADEVCGAPVSRLCFEGPYEELTRTENAQPALFTVSFICQTYARERGLQPGVAAGHSLGEYAALVAAEALDFETALELVVLRGRLMSQTGSEDDGMSAVLGLSLEEVRAQVDGYDRVSIANLNCPGQIVLSGSKSQLDTAGQSLKEAGGKVLPLAVAGAFHTKAMQGANTEFRRALEKVNFLDAAIPVVQNATGKASRKGKQLSSNLGKQMTSAVFSEYPALIAA